jgi:hypothetical protein
VLELDALRQALGFGPTEGEAWFELPEAIVRFAPHKHTNRAIILRTWGPGPTATLFARTRADQRHAEIRNPAHAHKQQHTKCWLNDPAWIVVSRPIVIDKAHLTDHTRMCTEDDPATIAQVLAS